MVSMAGIMVDGMSCEHCVATIDSALTGLRGVVRVDVRLKDKIVYVWYETTVITQGQLMGVIEELGYEVH